MSVDAVVRWTERDLPPGVAGLVADALHEGCAWMADVEAVWRGRPFIDPGEALVVVMQGGTLVAMAAISADPYVRDDHTGRLRFVYVGRTARRRGLADTLVHHCLDIGRTRWRRITLHTDNPVAACLYARYGFRPDDAEPRSTHVLAVGD